MVVQNCSWRSTSRRLRNSFGSGTNCSRYVFWHVSLQAHNRKQIAQATRCNITYSYINVWCYLQRARILQLLAGVLRSTFFKTPLIWRKKRSVIQTHDRYLVGFRERNTESCCNFKFCRLLVIPLPFCETRFHGKSKIKSVLLIRWWNIN
jgi:hypothetical protein